MYVKNNNSTTINNQPYFQLTNNHNYTHLLCLYPYPQSFLRPPETMGVFGDIRGYFGGSGSVFMIIALAGADYLWGEHVFNCPCGDYRILYTCAFLIVPPVAIILIGIVTI